MNPIMDRRTAGLAMFVVGATGLAVLFVNPMLAALIPPSLIGFWKLVPDLEKHSREKIANAIRIHRDNGDFRLAHEIAERVKKDELALFTDARTRENWEKLLPYLCFTAEKCASPDAWHDELELPEWNDLRAILDAYRLSVVCCFKFCRHPTTCKHKSLLRLFRALDVNPYSALRRAWHRDRPGDRR
jgi:hypothetical protein